MTEEEIVQLEKRVNDLKQWAIERDKERLRLPLDISSQKTLNKNLFVHTKNINVLNNLGVLLSELLTFQAEVTIYDVPCRVRIQRRMFEYTVDDTTDIFTNVNGQHNMQNGDRIALNARLGTGTGVNPGGLDSQTVYYIINSAGTTFQVSTTLGGSAVDVTTDGGAYTLFYGKL